MNPRRTGSCRPCDSPSRDGLFILGPLRGQARLSRLSLIGPISVLRRSSVVLKRYRLSVAPVDDLHFICTYPASFSPDEIVVTVQRRSRLPSPGVALACLAGPTAANGPDGSCSVVLRAEGAISSFDVLSRDRLATCCGGTVRSHAPLIADFPHERRPGRRSGSTTPSRGLGSHATQPFAPQAARLSRLSHEGRADYLHSDGRRF